MKKAVLPSVNLLDLPGSDVILKIIDYLSPSDWLNFRIVCKQTCFLVNEYFRYMKYLNLSDQPNNFPKPICQMLAQQCHSLKYIKLSNSTPFCDETLKKLLQNSQNLVHLDLSYCSYLKNGTLQPLVINCKKLETIILRNCGWVTIGAIEILAFHFPGAIKVADFSGCTAISEASVILFIKRQSKLESLQLSDLGCVRDETLVAISRSCNQLKHLDVSRCCGITDSGIHVIGSCCKRLQSLKAGGCPDVTERSLSNLRSCGVLVDKMENSNGARRRPSPFQMWSGIQL